VYPSWVSASAPSSDADADNTKDRANPDVDLVEYVPPTSVQPVHLSLNLRIQAFIEASRTVPLPGPVAAAAAPPPPPASTSVFTDVIVISANANDDAASTASSEALPVPAPVPKDADGATAASVALSPASDDADITEVSESTATNTTTTIATAATTTEPEPRELTDEQQIDLIHRAQKLYSSAAALENLDERTRYLQELKNVGGLLAYKVPERSPLVRYLSQERREAVANQINSAILCE
jgi:hypothetical protein